MLTTKYETGGEKTRKIIYQYVQHKTWVRAQMLEVSLL